MSLSVGFHAAVDDGFRVGSTFNAKGHASNRTPYWSIELCQSLACGIDTNDPPYRHARDGVSLYLHVEHMRILRDALSAALASAGLEVASQVQEIKAFELGVGAVVDHVAELHNLSIDGAEFDYADELARLSRERELDKPTEVELKA